VFGVPDSDTIWTWTEFGSESHGWHFARLTVRLIVGLIVGVGFRSIIGLTWG